MLRNFANCQTNRITYGTRKNSHRNPITHSHSAAIIPSGSCDYTLITNGLTAAWKDEIVFYGHSYVRPFAWKSFARNSRCLVPRAAHHSRFSAVKCCTLSYWHTRTIPWMSTASAWKSNECHYSKLLLPLHHLYTMMALNTVNTCFFLDTLQIGVVITRRQQYRSPKVVK